MSVMSGHPYGGVQFDNWNAYFSSAYGTNNLPYEFHRSPNTSGGSDESMNSTKTDPKRSPRYLEKRAKNNEAAKKSRIQRKERELKYQKDNEILSKELATQRQENEATVEQLNKMSKAFGDIINEKDMYKSQNAELQKQVTDLKKQLSMIQPTPFRDISNIKYEAKDYARL